MSHTNFHPAPLNDDGLKALQALEKDLGLTMVAVEQDPKPADLTDEQLAKLKSVEDQIGVSIIAYEKH